MVDIETDWGITGHSRASRIRSWRWSNLNIDLSGDTSIRFNQLDRFLLTKKPYQTGIGAGNNVVPKVG